MSVRALCAASNCPLNTEEMLQSYSHAAVIVCLPSIEADRVIAIWTRLQIQWSQSVVVYKCWCWVFGLHKCNKEGLSRNDDWYKTQGDVPGGLNHIRGLMGFQNMLFWVAASQNRSEDCLWQNVLSQLKNFLCFKDLFFTGCVIQSCCSDV